MRPPFANWNNLKFGYKFGEKTFYSDSHVGLDVLVRTGTSLYAPCDGKIIKVFNGEQGGLTIWFLDNENRLWRFLHLYTAADYGDFQEGDFLGASGKSGSLMVGSGHCHFDISRNGKLELNNIENFIDPLIVLKQKSMETIKIQDSADLNNDLKFKAVEFFFKNGWEIQFGIFVDYDGWIELYVSGYNQPAGGCGSVKPYKISFSPTADIERSVEVLCHEIEHLIFYKFLGQNLDEIRQKHLDWNSTPHGIQEAIDYLNQNLISDKKNTMVYILNGKGDQYIVIPEIRAAYSIADVIDLKSLQDKGLIGEPIKQEVPADYLKFSAVATLRLGEVAGILKRLTDLFNL